MCGIAGVLTPEADIDRAAVARLRDAMRHRGPDGCGAWQSPCGTAAFVHTRLAIFDPSPAGQQPMCIDGRYTIVYNGAVYNFAELRDELARSGIPCVTRTDTEVVARLFARDGLAVFSRLRGMFALAIWDATTRQCVLARDRFGIKPLYFSQTGRQLVFASEIRALAASRMVSTTLDPAGLYGYFRTGSVPEPRTILKDVRNLPSGCCAIWDDGVLSVVPYGTAPHGESAANGTARLRDALDDSITAHVAGDAPVGVFLSGGLDSTIILALLRRDGHPPVRTFSMTLPDTEDDEGPIARRTAAHFGAEHHECAIDAPAARAIVPEFLQAIDQPSLDGLNTFVVAKLAAGTGIKAVMSGVGADELFGGYPTFEGVPWLAGWHHRADAFGPLSGVAGRVLEGLATSHRIRRVGDLLQQRPGLVSAYETYRGIFTRREAATLTASIAGELGFDPLATGADDPQPGEAQEAQETHEALEIVSTLELTRYLRNQLLRDADAMSMAFGLEVRTPYLDAAVLAAARAMPPAIRIQREKQLIRQLVPELPAWTATRRKQCFQFPFDAWLGAEWKDMIHPRARTSGVALDSWYRKWSVFVLESWMLNLRAVANA